MWNTRPCLPILLITLVSVSAAPLSGQTALDTSFTFQGEIRLNNVVVNTPLDFQFTLYDSVTAGNVVGGSSLQTNVAISRGVFTVTLDFGVNAFDGDKRWLNIQVRPPGGGTFTTLAPRVELKSTPNAQYALKAGSSKDADALGGSQPADFVKKGEAASITAGMIDPHSVTDTEIAFQTITGTKLADGSVALVDLGTDSVDSSKILDGSIAAADLAAGILDGGDADTLDGINSTSFLRSDVTDSFTGPRLLVRSSSTLEVDGELRLDGTVTIRNGRSINVEGAPANLSISGNSLDLELDASFVQMLGSASIAEELSVGGLIDVGGASPAVPYNRIGIGTATTADVDDSRDLYVAGVLESQRLFTQGMIFVPDGFGIGWLGAPLPNGGSILHRRSVIPEFYITDRTRIQNELLLYGFSGGVDHDQTIYYGDQLDETANFIRWDDSASVSACSTASRIDSGFRWNIKDNTNSAWMFQNGTDIEMVLDQLGNLEVDGTLAQSGSCDIAEAFFAEHDLEPGTLVRLDPSAPEFVLATDRARDPQLVGVVSSQPGLLLRGPGQESYALRDQMKAADAAAAADPESPELAVRVGELEAIFDSLPRGNVPVALVGRVPCKVVGPVRAGEPLTSSDVPGHAMALDRPGPSIGLALEGSADGGTVLVLVQPGYRTPFLGEDDLKREAVTAKKRTTRDSPTKEALARMEERISQLESERGVGSDRGMDDGSPSPEIVLGQPKRNPGSGDAGAEVEDPPIVRLTRESWGDFDGDGLKDVLVLNPGAASRLFRNRGDGTFHDVTAGANLPKAANAGIALWEDYDRDQRLDLLLVNARGVASLHQGAGNGSFTDVTQALDLDFGQPIHEAEWLDYDHDGLPDLRVEIADGTLILHHNTGQGSFQSVELRAASRAFTSRLRPENQRIADLENQIKQLTELVSKLLTEQQGENR